MDAPDNSQNPDTLKDSSLKLSGYAYLLGDAALAASGFMAGRGKEAATGLIYAAGGLACARYGSPDAETQCRLLSHKLGDFLKEQGVAIPASPTTQTLTRSGGVMEHVEEFLYAYPSQVLNAVYAIGGVQLLRSGLQYRKGWDTASGACVAAGGLAGLLIRETPPDPDHPPQGLAAKAMSWIREKPLRVSGALYTLNNAALTMSAAREWRDNPAQKSYLFKFLTVASYVLANSLLASSSKVNGGGGKQDEILTRLADATAPLIAAQPAPLREALVRQTAAFLSAQAEIHGPASEIEQLLNARLAHALPPSSPETPWQTSVRQAELPSPSLPSH